MNKHPVVVVGAGIGGLACAARLAARGIAVEVLERAATVGGKLREIDVGGAAPMDAGPTVLTMRWVFDDLFDACGERLDERLSLTRASVLARHAWDAGGTLDLFADVERSVDAIGAFAGPDEGRRYRAFCDRARGIYRTLEQPFLRSPRPNPVSLASRIGLRGVDGLTRISPFATMWSELCRHFDDPRLRQLFGRYATYCGSSPFAAPATLMLVAHVEQEGVWLVDGGMHRIAVALRESIERLGGRVRCDADVARIVVERGRARAVMLANGERIDASAIVFNGDAAALADGLAGDDARRAVGSTTPAQRSLSAITWHLRARTGGVALLRHNVFFGADSPREFATLFDARALPDDPTVYVCAQDRGVADERAPRDARRCRATDVPRERAGRRRPATARRSGGRARRAPHARAARRLRARARRRDAGEGHDAERLRAALSGHRRRAVRSCDARLGRVVRAAVVDEPRPRTVPRRRQRASRARPADGRAVGRARRASHPRGGDVTDDAGVAGDGVDPARFDVDVPRDGYAWWYVDALSDDGRHALTIIAFLGSVFSPYYAHATHRLRRRGDRGGADPLQHCALNVALYGRPGARWSMTERPAGAVRRTADRLAIGPSAIEATADGWRLSLDEVAVPIVRRIRGTIDVRFGARPAHRDVLDAAGRHAWTVIAPRARIDVRCSVPDLAWSGTAYVDAQSRRRAARGRLRRVELVAAASRRRRHVDRIRRPADRRQRVFGRAIVRRRGRDDAVRAAAARAACRARAGGSRRRRAAIPARRRASSARSRTGRSTRVR